MTQLAILRGLWKRLELWPRKASDCSELNELLFCGNLEDNADGGKVCDVSGTSGSLRFKDLCSRSNGA